MIGLIGLRLVQHSESLIKALHNNEMTFRILWSKSDKAMFQQNKIILNCTFGIGDSPQWDPDRDLLRSDDLEDFSNSSGLFKWIWPRRELVQHCSPSHDAAILKCTHRPTIKLRVAVPGLRLSQQWHTTASIRSYIRSAVNLNDHFVPWCLWKFTSNILSPRHHPMRSTMIQKLV